MMDDDKIAGILKEGDGDGDDGDDEPSPPSGVSAKAMLSFFCLRASSSWNDDIFDTDSFLRHKMIHLLRSLSLLPHWNLLIFLTCKSKYKNQRT